MAINKTPVKIDFTRLQITLANSGLQQKDNALYQTINQLIDLLQSFKIETDDKFKQLGM